MINFISILLLITNLFFNESQEYVKDVKAERLDNLVKITYTLVNPSNEVLFIGLRVSKDGNSFSDFLLGVKGDVGSNISGRGVKQITWDPLVDFPVLDGNYTFQVMAIPKSNLPSGKSTEIASASRQVDQKVIPTGKTLEVEMKVPLAKRKGNILTMNVLLKSLNEDFTMTIDKGRSSIVDDLGNSYSVKQSYIGSNNTFYPVIPNEGYVGVRLEFEIDQNFTNNITSFQLNYRTGYSDTKTVKILDIIVSQ